MVNLPGAVRVSQVKHLRRLDFDAKQLGTDKIFALDHKDGNGEGPHKAIPNHSQSVLLRQTILSSLFPETFSTIIKD